MYRKNLNKIFQTYAILESKFDVYQKCRGQRRLSYR